MGDSSRHPSRTKRPWNSVSEPGRDLRGNYHGGKRGRRDPGGITRRELPPDYMERVPPPRRTGREYGPVPLERRSVPYSPKSGRAQSRYRSPPKASPRQHENPENECSPRLQSDPRHLPPPRDSMMYPRHHWAPWTDACPSVSSEMCWMDQQEGGGHVSQPGRRMNSSEIQGSVPYPGDGGVGATNRGYSKPLPNSTNGDDGAFVKLEPRGAGSSRSVPFKPDDKNDVILEPRTRIQDDGERASGDCSTLGPKKRLGFGDSVWRRKQQSVAAQVSAKPVDPPAEPSPVSENAQENEMVERKERVEVPEGKGTLEQVESVTADNSEQRKENAPLSKAEAIVMEMNKLDEVIVYLDQQIIDAERGQNEVEQIAIDLAIKVETTNQEGSTCSQPVVSSSGDSENGESQSNFLLKSPSGASQSGEVDAAGKVAPSPCGHGLCGQANGVISLPAVSKTHTARSCSDQDVSTTNRSASDERADVKMEEAPKDINLFYDERCAQVLIENRALAKDSDDEVWKGLPEHLRDKEAQRRNRKLKIEWDSSKFHPLLNTMRKWKKNQEAKEKELAKEYMRLLEEFKQKIEEGVACNMESDYVEELSRKPSRSYRVARSDYGEFKLVRELMGREDLESMVKVPDRDVYPWKAKMWINKNRLVQDPAADLLASMERSPWTDEEKKIFMDKFIDHPKDFRTIATFLDKRTTSDCVDLYYRIQKLDEFAGVRRKQQLKKRRQHAETKRTMNYAHLMLSPSQKARRFPRTMPQPRSRMRGNGNPGQHPHRLNPHDGLHAQSGRYRSEGFPWTDQEFVEAIRRHGTDMKAIALLFECEFKVVGTYALENWRRLGLDDVIAEREGSATKKEDPASEHHQLVNQPKASSEEDPGGYGDVECSKQGSVGYNQSHPSYSAAGPSAGMKDERMQIDGEVLNDGKAADFPVASSWGTKVLRGGGADQFSETLSLFTKSVHDTEDVSTGPVPVDDKGPGPGLDWTMSVQGLQANPQQFHQASLNSLSTGPQSSGYEQVDPQYLANQAGAGNLDFPNLLSAADICTLLSQTIHPNAQPTVPLQLDTRSISDCPALVGTGDIAVESSAGTPTMAKAPQDRVTPAAGLHPMVTETTSLRPSLLSGSVDAFESQAINQGDQGVVDGAQSQPTPRAREDGQLPGGLNSDVSALSVLVNALHTLPVGAPNMHPDHNQLNSLLTAATALQLLYGHGNQLLSQASVNPTSTPELTPGSSGHGYPPLFLASQAGNSMPTGQQLGSVSDRLCFQGMPAALQGPAQHQSAAGSPIVGPQDSSRQMHDPRFLPLLLAGMAFQPQFPGVIPGNLGSSQPPPGFLYQGHGAVGSSQPGVVSRELPGSGGTLAMVNEGGQMAVGAVPGQSDPNVVWTDAPQESRGGPVAGSPRRASTVEGIGGCTSGC